MTSAFQLAAALTAAIRANDAEEFRLQTQMGIAHQGTAVVAEILSKHLPALLPEAEADRMMAWMLGCSM